MKRLLMILLLPVSWPVMAQHDSTVTFTVSGNCLMCKERIENAAKGKGVLSATWEMSTHILTLRYNPQVTAPGKVKQRISDAGHDTDSTKAPDRVYKELPDCCLYRDGSGEHSLPGDGEQDAPDVMGVVMETDEKGNFKPLAGANIILKESNAGVTTNENGYFSLVPAVSPAVLVISYAGYEPREISVSRGQHLNIVLNRQTGLQEVKIISRRRSAYIPANSTLRTMVMTERELFKAACCNLSESFETNPSVDVSYNDAITGSRQIQLLGLSGNYSQLTVENLPGPRGLATPWGLHSIPGTWVESIQLTKGVGSVANGFESITGQVNVELKKPENSEQLYANVYVNNMGKTDLNLNLAGKIGKKWSVALLLHDAFLNNSTVDFNKDGFRDLTTGNLFTLLNRWKFDNGSGFMGQLGFRMLTDNRIGGQTAFEEKKHRLTAEYYGVGIKTDRWELFSKTGYVFPAKKYKSIGLQLSAFRHRQRSYFGLTGYDALQKNVYANLIYQSIIGTSNHKFRTGLSYVADDYDETYRNTPYRRTEYVPGAFFEYTYSSGSKLDIIAGLRGDHNSLFGFFLTPRLHIKYQPVNGTTFRLSAGRGQRTANIFAENMSVFISSRQVNIIQSVASGAYGLEPEVAWSTGIGIDQAFRLAGRSGGIGIDFFRTGFSNQVITDLDQSAREVRFYNLDGRSFANSFQAEIHVEVPVKLEWRLAYRLFDVRSTYSGVLLERPLVAKHRGFVNLAYERGSWKFDYTVSFNGDKRIPYTGDNPEAYKMAARSPSYVLMNAQVSRTIGKKWPVDLYIGSENITNYYQDRVVMAAGEPFSPYFDASLVWGPVSGRMFYTGARFKIK